MGLALTIFWLSIALLVYVYAGFGALVILVGAIRNRQVRKQAIEPRVSLLIAAYNEQESIRQRLENIFQLDYPHDRIEIIVASDGSDDATEEIVASYASRGVRLLSLPRRGKIHALNAAAAAATGELLVFSDANSMFERQALRVLVANFADPQVGGVGGNTVYTEQIGCESISTGENLYWNYDKWLKEMESRTGSIVSAHGAIYAIRRELYQHLTETAVTDDFAISTMVIEQGYRLVFEKNARAYEVAIPATEREFGRKVRMMTRGLRAVMLRKKLLNPLRFGFYSLVLFTHKLLRRLVSLALISLFISSLFLASSGPFYLFFALGQIVFYLLAALGYIFRQRPIGRWRLLYIPFFYCLANIAAIIAVINVIRGRQISRWQPHRHQPRERVVENINA
jgi:cellulose synthase/poly-beta-1,6-N-acetylglucosamine synthase-like glycosyltransferase